MKTLKLTLAALLIAGTSLISIAQNEAKLKILNDEVVVDVTPEEAWAVIDSYGDVGSYHSGISSSKSLEGSMTEGSMGCSRQCTIENGKKDVVVDEKIVEYVDGKYYRYEVTRFENFPAEVFFNTFGVKVNGEGKTVIYVRSEYRMNSGLMTTMAKGKLSKGNHAALIAYKHYMETGEENVDPKILKKKYKDA